MNQKFNAHHHNSFIPYWVDKKTGRSLRRAHEKEERKNNKLKNTPPKKKSWLDD